MHNGWLWLKLFTSYNAKYNWINLAYSLNKEPAHNPFPENLNTPRAILRFIGFVTEISVLTPKLPVDGQ